MSAARLRYGIVPFSTLVVSGSIALFALAATLFAFASYVLNVQHDSVALLNDVQASIHNDAQLDASQAGKRFSNRLFRPALVIVFVDGTHRVTVFCDRQDGGSLRSRLRIRGRVDRSGEPQAQGASSRVILGLAAIFGLQKLRANEGSLEIDVGANEAVFVHNVRRYVPVIWISLAFIVIATIVSTRILTTQALVPLLEVTLALERLASGDFSLQFVPVEGRGSLNALALAYNRAVAQVEQAFEERERAQTSVRRFIADAGHQLRTPLTVIGGYISILRRNDVDDVERILNTMHQQCLSIGSLVERLILLEQWEEAVHEPLLPSDLGELMREIVDPIARSQPHRSIHVTEEKRAFAAIDSDDFRHAVTNILENALKYTNGAIAISLREHQERVLVAISDEGPGLKPQDAERAFDRFFRGGRRDVEGSGLGLAIAKRAIERAHGSITLETAPDRGSCFTISLPTRFS